MFVPLTVKTVIEICRVMMVGSWKHVIVVLTALEIYADSHRRMYCDPSFHTNVVIGRQKSFLRGIGFINKVRNHRFSQHIINFNQWSCISSHFSARSPKP